MENWRVAIVSGLVGGFVSAALVLSMGMKQSNQPADSGRKGDPSHPSGLTKKQFEARANLYKSFRKDDLEKVTTAPVVAGVPKDGLAFVITPGGVGYWVDSANGTVQAVFAHSMLMPEFADAGDSGEVPISRVFDFRTGNPVARLSDLWYEDATAKK